MTLINLLVAPIRRVANFPLFQLMTAIAVILLLQAADSRSRRNSARPMAPDLPSGQAGAVSTCPLLRDERTCLGRDPRSVDDPEADHRNKRQTSRNISLR